MSLKSVGAELGSWGARAGEVMALREPRLTRRSTSGDKLYTDIQAGAPRAKRGWKEASVLEGMGACLTGGGEISGVFLFSALAEQS